MFPIVKKKLERLAACALVSFTRPVIWSTTPPVSCRYCWNVFDGISTSVVPVSIIPAVVGRRFVVPYRIDPSKPQKRLAGLVDVIGAKCIEPTIFEESKPPKDSSPFASGVIDVTGLKSTPTALLSIFPCAERLSNTVGTAVLQISPAISLPNPRVPSKPVNADDPVTKT